MANSFRIKVDLSEFFDDCRKESYIFVKQEWSTIKSIQSHIAQLFHLSKNPHPTLITGDGVYLPSEESIQILTRFDSIKVRRNSPVIIPKKSLYREAKLSSNSTLLDHCNLPALFNTNETPIVPIETLKKRSASQPGALLKKSKLSISFDTRLDDQAGQQSEEEDDVEEMETTTPNLSQKKKRRRIRKRKCKANGNAVTPTEEKVASVSKPNGQAKAGQTNGNSNQKNNSINKHTTFDSDESSDSSSEDEEEEEPLQVSAKFRGVDLPPNVSRIIKGIRTSCPVGIVENKSKTSAKSNGHGDQAEEVIDCSTLANIDESDLVEEEESQNGHEKAPEAMNVSLDVNKSVQLDALRKNLSTYPALDVLPNKNDIIGFRILKMSENYMPELSDYVIGLVETVDTDTLDLEIVILAGNDELKQHQEGGKFSLPDCNDTLVDIDDGTLHINWVELKDCRFVDK